MLLLLLCFPSRDSIIEGLVVFFLLLDYGNNFVMVSSEISGEQVFGAVFFSVVGCLNIARNITPKKEKVYLFLFGS